MFAGSTARNWAPLRTVSEKAKRQNVQYVHLLWRQPYSDSFRPTLLLFCPQQSNLLECEDVTFMAWEDGEDSVMVSSSSRNNLSTSPHPHLLRAIVTVAPGCISWLAATAASARDATACVASEAWVVWIVISPPWRVAQFCSTWRGTIQFDAQSKLSSAIINC